MMLLMYGFSMFRIVLVRIGLVMTMIRSTLRAKHAVQKELCSSERARACLFLLHDCQRRECHLMTLQRSAAQQTIMHTLYICVHMDVRGAVADADGMAYKKTVIICIHVPYLYIRTVPPQGNTQGQQWLPQRKQLHTQ